MTESEKAALWRKAAVLGSLWAASEIVLGSFLHNTRIPLRGNLLTGIGIAILVAGHRLWPRRGLLWRAGLVCAAMKSLSPSATILGPMIAISMEGCLLEAGVLLGGAHAAGYLLGGGLAMSWPLWHRLASVFLFYGPESWELYGRGLAWLGRPFARPWTPILALWAAHFLGGILAAVIGLRVGREPAVSQAFADTASFREGLERPLAVLRKFSLAALFAHILFVGAAMSFGARLPLWILIAAAAVYAALCVRAYPRAIFIMKRMSLWSGIVILSALAGLLLGRWQAGVQMGLRAVLLTLGFSCIGEELRNPVLRRAMERLGGRPFFDAVEQAFSALPGVFAGLPPGAQFLRSPVASLRAAVSRAPVLLAALEQGRVFIITGGRGAGKSTLVLSLAESLCGRGVCVGGISAPGFWEDGRRGGFDLVDLRTSQRRLLCRRDGPGHWAVQGSFRFAPEAFSFGLQALADASRHDVDVLMVDEVGPLELQGRGWAPQLDLLARERRKPMLWVVREHLVDDVKRRWGLAQARIWEAGKGNLDVLLAEILAASDQEGEGEVEQA